MKIKNKKLTNEEIYKKTKLAKASWYLIVVFGLATIVLAVSSLVFKISPIYCVITFIVETEINKYRNKLKEELKK